MYCSDRLRVGTVAFSAFEISVDLRINDIHCCPLAYTELQSSQVVPCRWPDRRRLAFRKVRQMPAGGAGTPIYSFSNKGKCLASILPSLVDLKKVPE